MAHQLTPKKLFPHSIFRHPFMRFPAFWEEFENEMEEFGWNQQGLSVWEDENNFYLEAQMPGLTAEDIDVTFDKGVIRIRGEREEKEEDKKKKYHRKASYSFAFQATLPVNVDESNVDATYKDGVMKMRFPKMQESKTRKIDVKKG